jgi:hypothetical protein
MLLKLLCSVIWPKACESVPSLRKEVLALCGVRISKKGLF